MIFGQELEFTMLIRIGLSYPPIRNSIPDRSKSIDLLKVGSITESQISIYSDSQAALLALSPKHKIKVLVEECMSSLKALAVENELKLVWFPGHSGIDAIH